MKKYILLSFLFLSACNISIDTNYLYENYLIITRATEIKKTKIEKDYDNMGALINIYTSLSYIITAKQKCLFINNFIENIKKDICSKDSISKEDFILLSKKFDRLSKDELDQLKDLIFDYKILIDSIFENENFNHHSQYFTSIDWENIDALKGEKVNSAELYTVLTAIQYNITATENLFQFNILRNAIIDGFSYNSIDVQLILNQNQYKVGDTLTAKIQFIRYDSLNGVTIKINDKQITRKGGIGYYSTKITNTQLGKHSIQGFWTSPMYLQGDTTKQPFTIEYEVIE
ncbi:MAG: hypothetical protein JXR68_10605 [Bacteroidales bacterium]|nr:hypothetical protein [Bacteroidales bacterium]